MLLSLNKQQPVAIITSDASGTWECGAVCGKDWFQLCWNGRLTQSHVTVKELTPVIVAAAIWGHRWIGHSILVRSDNMATVAIVNSDTSHNSEAMHLVRCLTFIAAKFQITISTVHIAGQSNIIVDAISRDNLPLFFSLCPQAHCRPTPIPAALVDLLLGACPDWTSTQWTKLWNGIFLLG